MLSRRLFDFGEANKPGLELPALSTTTWSNLTGVSGACGWASGRRRAAPTAETAAKRESTLAFGHGGRYQEIRYLFGV